MKLYYASVIIQDSENSKPWLCSMQDSCTTIKDAKEISCYDALTGRYTGEEDGWQKWKDLDEDTSYEVFCLCREFVAKTARGNRKTRIMNKGKNYVEPCGILRRLVYNFKRGEIEYTAGQDYNEEMKTLRGIFD